MNVQNAELALKAAISSGSHAAVAHAMNVLSRARRAARLS